MSLFKAIVMICARLSNTIMDRSNVLIIETTGILTYKSQGVYCMDLSSLKCYNCILSITTFQISLYDNSGHLLGGGIPPFSFPG